MRVLPTHHAWHKPAVEKQKEKTMTKIQLEEMAMGIAMRFHLSEYNQDIPALQAFDAVLNSRDESALAWEPFEDWEVSSLCDSIWNLADDVKRTFAEVLDIKA